MCMTINTKDGKSHEIETLLDLIDIITPKTYINIYTGNAYVFKGTLQDYLENEDLLEWRYKPKNNRPAIPFRDRKVISVRRYDIYFEPTGLDIRLEGTEMGDVWTLTEMPKLLREYKYERTKRRCARR